jgi:hypothetical protein
MTAAAFSVTPAPAAEDELPDQTYMPVVIEESFESIMAKDKAAKPKIMERQQQQLLEDTVEFFNLVLELRLTSEEKEALTAFMRCL